MPSYKQVQDEINTLVNYLNLIDNYKIESIENLIIYEYAIHNSISKVIKSIKSDKNNSKYYKDFYLITPANIKKTILTTPKDELHKIIKKQYLKKTLPQRRRAFK